MKATENFNNWANNMKCPSCKKEVAGHFFVENNLVEFDCYNKKCAMVKQGDGEFSFRLPYKGSMAWNYEEMISDCFVLSVIEDILHHDTLHDECCNFVPEDGDKENIIALLNAITKRFEKM